MCKEMEAFYHKVMKWGLDRELKKESNRVAHRDWSRELWKEKCGNPWKLHRCLHGGECRQWRSPRF